MGVGVRIDVGVGLRMWVGVVVPLVGVVTARGIAGVDGGGGTGVGTTATAVFRFLFLRPSRIEEKIKSIIIFRTIKCKYFFHKKA